MEEIKINKTTRNITWIIAGIILMGVFVVATTTISDTGITTTGDITADGDILFRGKQDIGTPGVPAGLDIGEGGSYTTNSSGATIVRAFTYDASASSGSRFTELTLDASNTFLNATGDRFYVGSTLKFWGARFTLTTATSGEVMEIFYYNGSALVAEHYMGFLKDSATTLGQNILNQTAEQEYVTWDHEIDERWVAADDVTDEIPDTPEDMFWIALQVPPSGIVTAPVVSEIKVRGTDFDFVSGASYPVFWGQARVEIHAPIALTVQKVPSGVTTIAIDIDSKHQQTVFDFDAAGDSLSFFWTLPQAIDTSSDLHITLDYSSDAADTFDLNLTAKKLMNNTPIGTGVPPDFEVSTAIVAAAADTVYNTVTVGEDFSIQNMSIDDQISFELSRTDDTNSIYPLSITIHYIAYSTGDHV